MKHILIIFLVLLCRFSLHAQKDTKGTEFWLTFARVSITKENPTSFGEPDTINLQIRITTGNQAATGTIYFTALNDSISFSVAAWSVFTHELTLSQIYAACYEIPSEYATTWNKSNNSVRITSDNPIAVYALNQRTATTDATNVLPLTALGTDYYHVSYAGCAGNNWGDYAVVATQDNTRVSHNGLTVAILNRGEALYCGIYIRHANYASQVNATSHVTADKPIALFDVIPGVFIPDNYYPAQDNLFQQLPPVPTWGRNFFVPVSRRVRDIVRIVASENGTNISQTGGTIRTAIGGRTTLTNLNAGQWVELEVSLDSNGCYIQADKPVGVCAYLTGCMYNAGFIHNGIALDTSSDPAQAWLPAVEQKINSALVAPFIPTGKTNLNAHYALLITPTTTKNSTTVKIGTGTEQALSGGIWHDHSSGYSFYDMPLTNGTSAYLFSNPLGKLIVMGYGIGQAESYYYLLASAMRNLEAWFDVNNIYYPSFDGTITCDENIEVVSTVKYPMDTAYGHLRWLIDSVEQTAFTDSLQWTTQLSQGKHTIVMIVKDQYGDADSIETSFVIENKEYTTIYDTICQGNRVLFGGQYYNLSGSYTDTLQTVFGCDSIITLNLHVNLPDTFTIFDAICPNNVYAQYGFNIPADSLQTAGTFEFKNMISNALGCDSIVVLQLTVRDLPLSVNLGNDTTICWLDSLKLNAHHPDATHYQWQDGSTGDTYTVYSDGQYWVVVTNQCSGASDTINVSYLKEIQFDLGNDTVFCKGESFYKELDVTSPYASYLWQDGSTSSTYVIEQEGVYSVIVSNACLSLSKTVKITTKDCRECKLVFPNIYTPVGGDGRRYVFRPLADGCHFEEFTISIYNRWGMLVWSKQCKSPNCPDEADTFWWNGTAQSGKQVPSGVYYWVISAYDVSSNQNPVVKNGSVTVVR